MAMNLTSTILSPQSLPVNVLRENVVNVNESYLRLAIDELTVMQEEYLEANKQFNRSILEAGNNQILVQEATGGFMETVKSIIDKFLKFIKRICARFNTAMNRIVKSDEHLIKNKAKFEKFTADQEFQMKAFTFTFLDDESFPIINAYDTYKRGINGDYSGIDSSKITTADELLTSLNAVNAQFKENSSRWYNTFRGIVMGYTDNRELTSSEFEKELFTKFRNGEETESSIDVNSDIVNVSYNRFATYKKTLDAVEKLQRNLEKQYTDIKRELKGLEAGIDNNNMLNYVYKDSLKGIEDQYKEKKTEVDAISVSIIKAKVDQIDYMCKIHSLAFTCKLDAIKAAYTQDKKLLYAALARIQKIHESVELPVSVDTI